MPAQTKTPEQAEALHGGMSATGVEGGEISVRVLRSLGELEEARHAWSDWVQYPNADIDFFKMVLGHGSGMQGPYVVALLRDGQPQALLIGRLENTRLDLSIGYRRVFQPRVRMLTFVNGGVLGKLDEIN